MELIISSPPPLEPRCCHFGECGGCQFQHIPYAEQLMQKENFVRSCFEQNVEPIMASHLTWCYRNKMEFSFAQNKKGEKFLGLMKKRGRTVNLEECYLVNPWFAAVLKNVRAWWQEHALSAYFPPANKGLLRTLILREAIRTGEKMAMLTISEEFFEEAALASFIDALPNVHSIILRKQIVQKKTPTRYEESVLKGKNSICEVLYTADRRAYQFRIRGASFFQPNTLQAETIYQKALAYAEVNANECVYDLYCGTGSLGIFASSHAQRVLGIEICREAVEDARFNLQLNTIQNMDIMEGDVQERLQEISFPPTTLFIDPPRVGLGAKTIQHINTLNPQKVVYISCNPLSQAADCKQLLNYNIEMLQPIDQFPHTKHVENIALLRRKK